MNIHKSYLLRFGKLFILGISILILLIILAGVQLNAETIRMAWFSVPPHVVLADDGISPSGPSITLFNFIAKRMGCSVEWIGPIPINRLGGIQKSGGMDIDGTILHIKTPAVIPYLYYPARPYFIAYPSLAVRAENPLNKIRTIEDIRGYRIAFVKMLSLSYPPIIMNNLDKVIIDDLSGDNWTTRNLGKLMINRIDAVYERNQYTLTMQAIIDGIDDKIKVLRLPADPILHYYVFHKNSPRSMEFLQKYEKATANWKFDYDAMVLEEIARQKKRPGGR